MTDNETALRGVHARASALRRALEGDMGDTDLRRHLQTPDVWCQDNMAVEGTVFGAPGARLGDRLRAMDAQPEATRRLFGAWIACALVETFDDRRAALVLTDEITGLHVRELSRMLDHAERRSPYWADCREDGPRKDLALLAGRLVPIGSGVAAPRSGLARSTLWKGGWQQAARFTRLLWASRGADQWLEIHTHTDSLSEFNPEGWWHTYRRLANLLRANPSIRGIFRASWFLDPALETISPNLRYLADLPRSGGAGIFYVEHDFSGTCGALQRSERRRTAFEAGQYVPAIYLMAWPRHALLAWNASLPNRPGPAAHGAQGSTSVR